MNNIFLRRNSSIEVIKSIKKLFQTIPLTKKDKYEWKWAIIIFHNVIQNIMVVELQGFAQVEIIKDNTNDKRHIKEHLDPSNKSSKQKLENFIDLYKKIPEIYTDSITGLSDDIECVNRLRNDFIHFSPKYSSLFINNLPDIFLNICNFLNILLLKSMEVKRNFKDSEIKKMRNMLDKICNELNTIKKLYKES